MIYNLLDMVTCNDSYGKVTGIIYVPTYKNILSEKIRDYLVRKWWSKIGVQRPKTNALSHWNKGYISPIHE